MDLRASVEFENAMDASTAEQVILALRLIREAPSLSPQDKEAVIALLRVQGSRAVRQLHEITLTIAHLEGRKPS